MIKQSTRDYEIAFNQLRIDYESSKKNLMNTLILKLKEISVWSPNLKNIATDVIKIQNDLDVNLHHRNLVDKTRQEISERRSSNKFSNWHLSMVKKLDMMNRENWDSSSPSSQCSNSNYDYELEASEAKDLWKKHLLEEQDTLDSRFKKIEIFKNAFSPIENKYSTNNYNEVEFEFEDSRNMNGFKSKKNSNSIAFNSKGNSYQNSNKNKNTDLPLRRRKVCHRRSSSLMDKVSNDVKFTMDVDAQPWEFDKSYDVHDSSDFNPTKVYLNEVEQRVKRTKRDQSLKNKKNIKIKKAHLKINTIKEKGKIKLKRSKKLKPTRKDVDVYSTDSDF